MKRIVNSSRLVVWILLVALLIALPIMVFSFSSRFNRPELTAGIKIPGQTQTEVLVPYTGTGGLDQQEGSPPIPAIKADTIEKKAAQSVGLYDVFEVAVTNDRSYANPFDYQAIELQADFTAPSGKKVPYFGFYDGDGKGGSQGNVWKLRFMPNETGKWSYVYRWTDGADRGSGSFDVVDTGLPGPLKVARPLLVFTDCRMSPSTGRNDLTSGPLLS
jgi:hypothetical protein